MSRFRRGASILVQAETVISLAILTELVAFEISPGTFRLED
jgi:hypothetical protein